MLFLAGEAFDARTLRFLLARSLPGVLGARSGALWVKEEEETEEKGRAHRRLQQWYVHGWLRWFCAFAVSLSFIGRPLLPGILDGMDQYDSFLLARRRPRHWLMPGWFCWYCSSFLVLLRCLQAHDALHHGWFEPKGQLRGDSLADTPVVHNHIYLWFRDQKTVDFPQLQSFKFVDTSFVTQRVIPMVLPTMKILQLQFLNEVIDVFGVQVVQVLPSRLPVVCNDRCPAYVPQLQLINKFMFVPVVAQSCIPTVWQTIEILLFPYTGGRCSCCVGRASSTVAVCVETVALPQLQLVEKIGASDVFDIPVVTQRPFHMVQPVWRTIEIPQSLFDKVIDVPVVMVVRVAHGHA